MIDSFRNEYSFLSNFCETPIYYDGLLYNSTEAAFQAQKCKYQEEKKLFCKMTPSKAKQYGRKVDLVENWEEKKDKIMFDICFIKFSLNEELKIKLLKTGNEELVEGNTWNDCYWGVCKGKGLNKLGKILMSIRTILKERDS